MKLTDDDLLLIETYCLSPYTKYAIPGWLKKSLKIQPINLNDLFNLPFKDIPNVIGKQIEGSLSLGIYKFRLDKGI